MSLRIDQDHSRFRNIVRGRIRQNLRKYISKGELLGRQGKDIVSIPIPHIDIPKLRFGDKQQGGVAQGDGEPGDALSGDPQDGDGAGKAGDQAGDHALEVELTLDELADILGEELELPNIENKGKSAIIDKKDRYVGVRNVGPNSLRHFKRTFRSALRRQIALGLDTWLMGRVRRKEVVRIEPVEGPLRERAFDFIPRQEMPTAALTERFHEPGNEVETGLDEDLAFEEAKRCYLCNLKYQIDVDNCIYCRACIEVAPKNCIKLVEGIEIKADGTYGALAEAHEWDHVEAIWIDNNECIRCGACFMVCPTRCISITRNEIVVRDV